MTELMTAKSLQKLSDYWVIQTYVAGTRKPKDTFGTHPEPHRSISYRPSIPLPFGAGIIFLILAHPVYKM